MKKAGTLFFALFLFTFQGMCTSQRSIVKSLEDDFFTLTKATHTSMPLFKGETTRKGFVIVDIEKYHAYDLTFEAQTGMCLFVNNQLIFKAEKPDTIYFPVDKIHQFASKQVVLSFYSPNKALAGTHFSITTTRDILEEKHKELIPRVAQSKGVIALFLLFILSFMGIIKNKDNALWNAYFNFKKLIASRTTADEYVLRSIFSTESLMLLTLSSLLISAVLSKFHIQIIKTESITMSTELLNIVAVFFLLFLKYWYIKMVTAFLNISIFGSQQFYRFIRYLMWLTIIILLLAFLFENNQSFPFKVVLWGGLTFWNIRILSSVLAQIKFQKLYLFSYICASELIPAIVLINFIETIN